MSIEREEEQENMILNINENAPAKSKHEIKIYSSSENIWEVLIDINNWNKWRPAITSSNLIGGLVTKGAIFKWKSGGISITSTIRDVEQYKRLSWTGKAIGTQAIHVWILEQKEGYVLVKSEESFDGWLSRLFKGTMQQTLDSALQEWLEQLKNKSEENH